MTASTAVHPKVRARRVEVRRKEGRRRLRLVLWMAALAVVLAGAYGLTRSPLLDVDNVVAESSERITAEQLVAAAAIDRSTPMVDLDLVAIADRIRALPWVLDVSVRRDWPNSVVIDGVVERGGAAVVSVGVAEYALLDRSGQVLDISTAFPAVPKIVSPVDIPDVGGRVESLAPALRAADQIPDDLNAWVDSVVLRDDGGVDLVLVDGVTVLLGSSSDYSQELDALAAVLAGVDLTCLDTIDVQIHDRPVLTRHDHCA